MPSGWPKGKPRGLKPRTDAQRRQVEARAIRVADHKRKKEVAMAGGVGIVDISPAAWLSAEYYVGDCEYIDGDLDEGCLRAAHDRVLYADRLGYHEPPFQDLTIDLLAAVEKQYRKNGKRAARGIPRALRPERPIFPTVKKIGPFPPKITPAVEARADAYEKEFRAVGKKRAAARPLEREGSPLTAVVAEMFPRVGKPLTEVVSDLFDS